MNNTMDKSDIDSKQDTRPAPKLFSSSDMLQHKLLNTKEKQMFDRIEALEKKVAEQAELIDKIHSVFFPPQSVTSLAEEVNRARGEVAKIVFTDVENARMIMKELRERKV